MFWNVRVIFVVTVASTTIVCLKKIFSDGGEDIDFKFDRLYCNQWYLLFAAAALFC